MKQTPEYLQKRLETCRKLFFQYNGREHARIEREMRASGFPDFNRRCLYARGINSGWIEKYRWDRELLWSVNSEQRTVNSRGDDVSTESGSDRGLSFTGRQESSRQGPKPQGQSRERNGVARSPVQSPGGVSSPHVSKGPVSTNQHEITQNPSRQAAKAQSQNQPAASRTCKQNTSRGNLETNSRELAGVASGIFVVPGEAKRNPGYKHPQDPGAIERATKRVRWLFLSVPRTMAPMFSPRPSATIQRAVGDGGR
jgi:hypothetical protein